MSLVRLHLAGGERKIRAKSLVSVLRRSLDVLDDLDRAIAHGRSRSVTWLVDEIKAGSIDLLLRSEQKVQSDQRIAAQVSAGFIHSLDAAEFGKSLPPLLTDVGLKSLEEIGVSLSKNGATTLHATYVEEDLQAVVSAQAAQNVQQLRLPRHSAVGSIIGRLETISLHRRAVFYVYDDVTGRAVRCTFNEVSIETVKHALGARVAVAGTIVRNRIGQPLRVDESTVTVLPLEDELPSIGSFMGVDPDFTGGASTAEYLDELTDA